MSRLVPCFCTLAMVFTLAAPERTEAVDGRTEINQASIDAGGGFPFTINEPGSYVLTGPLMVPAGTDGIIIGANEVFLDLNGFSISGPATCGPGNCTSGPGEGVRQNIVFLHANRSSLRNGVVQGFANVCVRLGSFVNVQDVVIRDCGLAGIVAGINSVLTRNVINRTGTFGISMLSGSVYFQNSIFEAGLGGGGEPAVAGGIATGGNFCDDRTCFRVPARRYYFTPDLYNGDQADDPANCEPGFHFAALGELINPGALRYDTSRSIATLADSGQGPPTYGAWVRTGGNAVLGSSQPGEANCGGWTSNSPSERGTRIGIGGDFDAAAERTSPWRAVTGFCGSATPIVCIED